MNDIREKIIDATRSKNGDRLIGDKKIDAILAIVRKALREEAGKRGDEFICAGCLWEVCQLLGEVSDYHDALMEATK